MFYQYFYHDGDRHVVEKIAGYSCSFCLMTCRSLIVSAMPLEHPLCTAPAG